MRDELLRNDGFLKLWSVGALQSVARWLELLALGVYVFDLTHSPLMVTMVALVKFAPLALFGIPFGVLSGRFPPRSIYLVGIVLMIIVNLGAVLLASFAALSITQVLLISFAGGLFWVLDFPVRRALIGDAVAHDALGRAMAVDTIANNGTRLLGPLAGGALLQFAGLSGAFLFSALLYVICLLLTWKLPIGRVPIRDQDESLLNNLLRGLQLARRTPVLLATLLVTVVYNIFGFPMLSLVPVIGREILQLSAGQVGLLAAMEGGGALVGSALVMRFGVTAHFRRLYVGGVLVFFIASGVYAHLHNTFSVGGLLLIAGAGSAAFAAMQTTLLIINSPREFRSRLFGLLSLSIGAGLIGIPLMGITANLIGVQNAVLAGAVLGALSVAAICYRWPVMLQEQAAQSQ